MGCTVFISHSDKDCALADGLLQALEQRGVTCWIAPRDIRPGGSYAESIMSAIEASDALVLIYTQHSNVSPHVLREVEQALRLRKNIMPIRFDDSPVSKALDYLLSTVHWISASAKPEAIARAAEQIAGSISPDVEQPKAKPAAVSPPRAGEKRVLTWLSIFAAVAIIFIIGLRALRNPRAQVASGENILAAENGGQTLVSPNAAWVGTIDGRGDQVFWFMPGDEGVFGFKDARPATFSRFSLLIPDSDTHNLKEFELLAGDDSPFGQFQSIGKFKTQNRRDPKSDGYQEFNFAPRTAKFLKVKLIAPHDGNDKRICLYEFRLFGQLAGATGAASPEPRRTAINLLSPDNGGAVALAPNENWKQTIDDREEQLFWFEPHEEAVYQFKDGRAATFDSFALLIPDNDEHNVKEFELLAGNDSPRGEFHSIDKFKTHNARVGTDGYQQFKFPPVTAKYLKVRLLAPHSTNDPRIYLYEFRLFGQSKD
jgi:hypothetical protein